MTAPTAVEVLLTPLAAAESLNTVVGRQLTRDAWGNVMPVLLLTERQMTELLEYSCSIPTGKTIGKRWKRCTDRKRSLWSIGEYANLSAADLLNYPGEIAILWYLPSIDGAAPGKWRAA